MTPEQSLRRLRRRPTPAIDSLHEVPVFNPDGEVAFILCLYGLTDKDLGLCPNPYVSTALNRRGLEPGMVNVSPFYTERVR